MSIMPPWRHRQGLPQGCRLLARRSAAWSKHHQPAEPDADAVCIRGKPARKKREAAMGHGSGIREIAWLDCAGGGQVVLDGHHAYIGHMDPPHGTSVVDIADPANPRIVASIDIPFGLHSHKVRVANDIMVVNRER